jgi:hypothetical protein
VPSEASEFSHPDVAIGFAILAYRFGGLRPGDAKAVLCGLRERMQAQGGVPFEKVRGTPTAL